MTTKTALVIVDVQEDFLPPSGSLAVSDGRHIIPGIVRLIGDRRWACVAASMDWHPRDHCSFASQQKKEPFSEMAFLHPEKIKDSKGIVMSKNSTVWPDHCVQNTAGAQIEASVLEALRSVQVPHTYIQKGMLRDREYYSSFGDIWGLHKTPLESFLRENGVSVVVFVGIAYDYCVLNSALDSARLGFKSYVVKDLCRAVDGLSDKETEAKYCEAGVGVCTVSELDDILS